MVGYPSDSWAYCTTASSSSSSSSSNKSYEKLQM